MSDERAIELSVVVPVYNSEQSIGELTERLQKTLKMLVDDRYEIILINDGSRDQSWKVLQEFATADDKLTAINLTRNFGQHNAIMCGFSHATGTFIVTIDDDLQIPPEEISKLYRKIQEGYDVVYGTYKKKNHSRFRNLGSEFVQLIYRKTFNMHITITSFRIIRQEIIRFMLSYEKSFTYIDGLLCWYSNNMNTVIVEHHKRGRGESGYSLSKLILLALNMLTNFSIVPLQIASLTGVVFAFTGFSFGLYFLLKKLIFGIAVSGFASTFVAITIFAAVQLLTIGMLGEYIGRIHINVSKRPQFAIREIVNGGMR